MHDRNTNFEGTRLKNSSVWDKSRFFTKKMDIPVSIFKDLFSFSVLFCFFFNGKENDLLIFKYCSYFFISNSLLVFFAIFLKNRGIIDLENSDLPSPYTKKATRKCQILTLINALKQIT